MIHISLIGSLAAKTDKEPMVTDIYQILVSHPHTNSLEVDAPIVMSWSRAPPAAAPTTAGNVMRCGASSATRHSNSETRRLTYGSGWLSRENSCGMMPFQGRVGVVASPDSSTVCSSRACLTISRRRRKVAVMVVQLFSIPPFTLWRMLKYKLCYTQSSIILLFSLSITHPVLQT